MFTKIGLEIKEKGNLNAHSVYNLNTPHNKLSYKNKINPPDTAKAK